MRSGWLLTMTFAMCLCAEVVLTNDTVLKLVRAGIGQDSIIEMIVAQPGVYALSADELAALKKAGATDKIVAAMLVKNSAANVAIRPAPDPAPQRSAEAIHATALDKAELTIISSPGNASVEIDGVLVGATPVTVRLSSRTGCAITVKKDGFVPWRTNYAAASTGQFTITANLTVRSSREE
jgi:hypothetical protein